MDVAGVAAVLAAASRLAAKRNAFLIAEGAVAVLEPANGVGDSGSLLVAGGGSRNPKDPPVTPQLAVATEHYNRIARLVGHGQAVTMEIDLKNTFHDADLNMFNIVAEIPGTDKADEIVMLGAHFDSWHSGTGSVDNAAGSAAMLEAMRILKQSGLRLRRTVRMALWTGEEQGLIGSRMYVRNHFADPADMKLKPEHAKLAGYFNMDNGTGQYRGVYLQGNEAVAPIFRAWMMPFANLGMSHLTIRNTGGTDHLSFNNVGLSGFQFIQDPVQVLEPHAPLEPRRLRSADSVGHDEERGDHRGVRLSHGKSRADAAAQAAAETGGAGAAANAVASRCRGRKAEGKRQNGSRAARQSAKAQGTMQKAQGNQAFLGFAFCLLPFAFLHE